MENPDERPLMELRSNKNQQNTTITAQPSRINPVDKRDSATSTSIIESATNSFGMEFLSPAQFSGLKSDDPKCWIQKFELYCNLRNFNNDARRAAFIFSMKDSAARWINTVPDDISSDWTELKKSFLSRFDFNQDTYPDRMQRLWSTKQGNMESVRDYIDRILSSAKDLEIEESILTTAIQAGMKPSIKQYVARQKPPTSIRELTEYAVLAETTDFSTSTSTTTENVTDALKRLENKIDEIQLTQISAAVSEGNNSRDQFRELDEINHPRRDSRLRVERRGGSGRGTLPRSPSPGRNERQYSPTPQRRVSWSNQQQNSGISQYSNVNCYRCLGNHLARFCTFKHVKCYACSMIGHLERACKNRPNNFSQQYRRSRAKNCKGNQPSLGNSRNRYNKFFNREQRNIISPIATNFQRNVINVRIENKFCKSLIDTGCHWCLMNKNFAKKIGANFETLKPDHPKKLYVANGAQITIKHFTNVSVNIENVDFLCEVLITRDLNISTDLILGVQFLRQHNAILNFNENTLCLDDNICAHVSVKSDTRDLLTLSDFTKLKPFTTAAVRVNVPTRFNRRLIEIAPFKPIREGHVVIERAINIPARGSTEIILINTSNKPIYLPKTMNVATCELLLDNEIAAISELTADAPPKFTSDSTDDSDLIYFNPSTLNADAPSFEPRGNNHETNESAQPTISIPPTITLNEKYNVLKTIGLNLDECKISPSQKDQLVDLLFEYRDCFDTENLPTEPIPGFEHTIKLKDNTPVYRRQYKNRIDINAALEVKVAEMLKAGVIEKTISSYNSPALLISKPGSKSSRLVLDLRLLNSKVQSSYTFLHDINDVILKIMAFKAKFFTSFDIKNAFHSVKLAKESRHLTAFSVTSNQYQYRRLPQGLACSSSIWCRIINHIFLDCQHFLSVYLDDLLVANDSFEPHLKSVEIVLQRTRDNNLRINAHKCHLFTNRVPFLGYILTDQGRELNPDKLKPILTLEPPKNVKELRQLIGATSYVRAHIAHYSHIVAPLTRLLRKKQEYIFDQKCKDSFDKLIEAFKSPLILRPFEIGQPVYFLVDASTKSISSILCQKDPKTQRLFIVECIGRQLNRFEQSYTISELEMLSIIYSLRNFRQYLSVTTEITVYSDHISLSYYKSIRQNQHGRLQRWALILSQYSTIIQHIRGVKNQLADLISRRNYPPEVATDIEDEEMAEVIMNINSNSNDNHVNNNNTKLACSINISPRARTSSGN